MVKFNMPKMFGAVTVGERGQVVIPAEVRKLFKIKSGDKLIVIAKPEGPIGFIPEEQFNQFLASVTQMQTQIQQKKQ